MATSGAPLAGGHLSHVFVLVRDLEAALTFYRDKLGLDVVFLAKGQCAFLTVPGTRGPRIALYAGRTTPATSENHWFLVIDVPEIEVAVARLRSAGVAVSGIEDVPYGRAAKLDDGEGNLIEIHEAARAR